MARRFCTLVGAALFALALLPSCHSEEQQQEAAQVVQSFANAFFNYDFRSSMQFATPESRQWISFLASNITQDDLNTINAMNEEASCATPEITLIDDTTATARLSLQTETWLGKDSVDLTRGDVSTVLQLRKRGGVWLVHLTEIPQIEYNRK